MAHQVFKKLHQLATGQTAKNVYIATFGNGLNATLGFVSTIIVSRALGPAGFGIFSIAFGVFMSASKFTDLGVNYGMSRFVSKNSKAIWQPYAKYSLIVKLGLTLVVSIVGLLLSNHLAVSVFNKPELTNLLSWSFLALLGIMLLDFYTALAQALGKFVTSVSIQMVTGIIKLAVLGFLLYLSRLTTFNSYAVYLAVPLFGAVVGHFLINGNYMKSKVDGTVSKQVLGFSAWMGVGIFISAIAGNLDTFMVGAKLSAFDTGIYAAANRLTSAVSLLASGVGTVLAVRASSFSEQKHLLPFLKKTLLLSLMFLVVGAVLWVLSTPIIILTVGEAFVGSILLFKVLLLSALFSAAKSAFSANFFGHDKPQYFAFSAILSTVVIAFGNSFLIPLYGALGAAYVNLITSVLMFVFSLVFLRIFVSYGHKSTG